MDKISQQFIVMNKPVLVLFAFPGDKDSNCFGLFLS